jgi:hypothetical protein
MRRGGARWPPGPEVIYPLEDQFYGERGGRLRDPFGQQWMMSQHVGDVPTEEWPGGPRPCSTSNGRRRPGRAWTMAT